jgi:hypothetical protein
VFEFFHIRVYSRPVTFVSAGFLYDNLQQHIVDDGKKELDVDNVEHKDDDAVDDDDKLDKVPDLEDHDEKHEGK